jgi:RimJ/RimL family protein N-acetyltransferase
MLETDRLTIFPLTPLELEALLNRKSEFEENTGYRYEGERLEGMLYQIFSRRVNVLEDLSKNLYFHTMWVYAMKSDKTIVGSIACKNAPDDSEDIEIGYGINRKYEKHGYTTEAVKILTEWILQQDGVKSVVAEVDKGNIGSRRVLEKCGMKKYRTVGNDEWYKLLK